MKKSFTKLTATSRYKLLSILSQTFKDPKSELNFEDPFELLCAVVLSAQATDKSVNKVTPTLFKVAKTPYQLKDLPVEELEGIIKSIGLYKNKAKNLIALAKMLCDNFGGVVPSNYDDLIKLPGVGSKTAKVVLNVAFNQPTIAVDTHIFRVCNRTCFCIGKTVKEVEDYIVDLVPDEFLLQAHHLLLLHGRYTCTAKNPKCDTCPIASLCKKNIL